MCACVLIHFSRVQRSAALWTVAHQAALSTGFFRQEYWSGLASPSPGGLPDQGIKPAFPPPVRFLTAEPPGKPKLQILLPSKGINTSEFETDIVSGCGVKAKALNWNQKTLIFLLLNERPWRK